MPKVCKLLGIYDVDQGMTAFCVAEMFFAYVHLLNSLCIVHLAPKKYFHYLNEVSYGNEDRPELGIAQWVMFGTYAAYMIMLLVQAVFAFLLYFIGFRKKSTKIILIWMLIAIFNFTCPAVLLICGFIEEDLGGAETPSKSPDPGGIAKEISFFFLYMLYLEIGFPVVAKYQKHLRKQQSSSAGGIEQNPRGSQTDAGASEVYIADITGAVSEVNSEEIT